MARPKVISAADAARLIPDGAVVTISSSSGLGCPDATLAAIGARFDAEGRPRNITTLHPIAAGDMWGVKGVDHLAKPGCLARVLAGSYPSGPSSAEPPEIWKMITGDVIPAYNVPSGILFDIHREAAAKRPGVLTKVGMDTFVDPVHEGCAMNTKATADPIVKRVNFAGEEWLFFPTITPQVAIIRATTADERGNLSYEHEGAILGPLDQALAVRNNGGIVIAQVKRLAAAGTLKPHDVVVPGVLVDYIVVAPEQLQTTHTAYEPAISGEVFRPLSSFETPKFDIAKVIARRVAQELRDGRCREHRLRHLGQRAADPHRGRQARGGDVGDRAGRRRRRAAARLSVRLRLQRRGDRPVAAPVHLFPGRGLRHVAALVPADRPRRLRERLEARRPSACHRGRGRVRRHHGARQEDRLLRLLHSRGEARGPRTARSESPKEGKVKKLVEAVEQISFSGPRAIAQGQEIVYVTERCVLRLEKDGVTVTELAPGVDLERDVLAQAEFPLRVAKHVRKMDPALFHAAPINLQLRTAEEMAL